MRIVSYFFLLTIVIFGMSFATLNSESVTLDYYMGQTSIPLSLLLVILYAMGCLVGMAASIWMLIKSKLLNHRLRQQLNSAEKEAKKLRLASVEDTA